MQFSVLDTFAGAGGFSLGFELAGAKIVGAIEIDSRACETFQFNHPEAMVLKGDITQISDEKIIEVFGRLQPDIILEVMVVSKVRTGRRWTGGFSRLVK